MAAGVWDVTLKPGVPSAVRRAIDIERAAFGTFVVLPAPLDPRTVTDDVMLARARYVGLYRRQAGRELGGPSLNVLVGDEDGKGDVFESVNAGQPPNGWFSEWFNEMTPAWWALRRGNFLSPGGSWRPNTNGAAGLYMQDRRTTWDQLCDRFGVEWRIRTTLHFDAGPISWLYGTTPSVMVLGPSAGVAAGRQMGLTGVSGTSSPEKDFEDYSTKVILKTGVEAGPFYAIRKGPDRFLSPAGTPMVLDRMADSEAYKEAPKDQADVDQRHATAQSLLTRFSTSRVAWSVGGGTYDIGRDTPVGSPIYLFDPDQGLMDRSAPGVQYRGSQVFPATARLMRLTTPIRVGSGVYLRTQVLGDAAPTWTDLTPYVEWETGEQGIELGAAPRTV